MDNNVQQPAGLDTTSAPEAEVLYGVGSDANGQQNSDPGGDPPSLDAIDSEVNQHLDSMGLPDLDTNAPVNTEPDIWSGLRGRIENGPNMNGWGFDTAGFMNDLYQVGQSAIYGVGSGAQELGQGALDVAASMDSSGRESSGNPLRDLLLPWTNSHTQQYDEATSALRDSIPNIMELAGVPKPDSTVENVVASVAPFVATGWFGKGFEGLKALQSINGIETGGLLGQGLGRVAGNTAGKLAEALGSGALTGAMLPEDADNWADTLRNLSGRNDMLGSVARTWLNVPGVEGLAKDAGDSDPVKKLKNVLDAAYGTVAAPLLLAGMKSLKLVDALRRGEKIAPEVLESARLEQELADQVAEKLGKDTSTEAALDELFPGTTTRAPVDKSILPETQISVKRSIPKPGEDNFLTDIGSYVDTVYHETNVGDAQQLLTGRYPSSGPMGGVELFWSNTPEMALGQGSNKGVRFEVSAKGLQGKVHRGKPGLDFTGESGYHEFVTRSSEGPLDIKSVTFTKLERPDRVTANRLRLLKKDLESQGWVPEQTDAGVRYTKPTIPDMESAPAGLDDVAGDVTGDTLQASAVKFEDLGEDVPLVDRLKSMLNWSDKETLARIKQAKESLEQADRDALDEALKYQKLTEGVDVTRPELKFDTEAYIAHLNRASESKEPGAFEAALGDWSQYVENPQANLLDPKDAARFDSTPYKLTGSLIESIKRVTTTDAARKEQAVRYVADILGGGYESENQAIARRIIETSMDSVAEVDRAVHRMLVNRVHLKNNLLPNLERAARLASLNPDDVTLQRAVLKMASQVNKYKEADNALGSAAGRFLQSRKIDPEIADQLKAIYGAKPFDVTSPTAARAAEMAEAERIANLNATEPLTQVEKLQVEQLVGKLGWIDPDARAEFASSVIRSGMHPIWKRIGNTGSFGGQLFSEMVMSGMLFHPSTWNRVLSGVITASGYDAIGQMVGATSLLGAKRLGMATFRGQVIDNTTYQALQIGAMYRLYSLPRSLFTAAKSFLQPELAEAYKVGTSTYKVQPALSPEIFSKTFGKDVATKIFTGAGGIGSRVIRTAGAGLGIPMHMLGSFDVLVNHSHISGRAAEELTTIAIGKGLKGKAVFDFINKHLADVMEDMLVAAQAPAGSFVPKNRLGILAEDLRKLSDDAGRNADYTSLREMGQGSTGQGTEQLNNTLPFRLNEGVNKLFGQIPVIGGPLKTVLFPFGKVTANIVHRQVAPWQGALDLMGSLANVPGTGGAYIRDVMNGGQGAHRQAQLVGHTLMYMALYSAGLVNYNNLKSQGKAPVYSMPGQAEAEARSVRGVRPSESVAIDGSTITTGGLVPYVSPWDVGNYTAFILDRMNGGDGKQYAGHLVGLAGKVAPFEPLFHSIVEMGKGLSDRAGTGKAPLEGALSGIAAGVGDALERPLRIGDLRPGHQVPGRNMTIRTKDPWTAFQTAAGGFTGEPNQFRVNAYDMFGKHEPDKYDPDDSLQERLDAVGLPTVKSYDNSNLGRYLAELEARGLTLEPAPKRVNVTLDGINMPVELTTWYDRKARKHLWDVYNEALRNEKFPIPGQDKEADARTVLERYAQMALGDSDRSVTDRTIQVGDLTRKDLSGTTSTMNGILLYFRERATAQTQIYINEHMDDIVDWHGKSMRDISKENRDADMQIKKVQP